MLGEVPTMAIEEVKFFKNDSVLYDEIIAHRLGLVVMKTDLSSYKLNEGTERIESPQYELKLSMEVEGPKTVYAKDLVSKDPAVQPVYPNTIIVKLLEGQKLELEATAILGVGNQHTKWAPGLIWYSYEPVIKVDNKAKSFDESKAHFPPQIFNDKGAIDAKLINTPELVDACIDVDTAVVDITFDNKSFRFTVESFGALTAKEIVTQALDVFGKQITTFEGLVKELK
jgi:DNA-directed RNA polymerase subunit D